MSTLRVKKAWIVSASARRGSPISKFCMSHVSVKLLLTLTLLLSACASSQEKREAAVAEENSWVWCEKAKDPAYCRLNDEMKEAYRAEAAEKIAGKL